MSNVAHSTLTGTDLHESKGTAAAAANTVFVADGGGSGSYQKVPNAALASLSNAFGTQLYHLQEVVSVSIVAGTNAVGGWTTLVSEFAGASFSGSQITLPAGTYFIEAQRNSQLMTASHYLRLQNLTTSTTLLSSMAQSASYLSVNPYVTNVNVNASGAVTGVGSGSFALFPCLPLMLRGRFTLSASQVVQVQHISNGTGQNGTSIGSAIFGDFLVWKIS